jgi:hypothetical protein
MNANKIQVEEKVVKEGFSMSLKSLANLFFFLFWDSNAALFPTRSNVYCVF